MLKRQQFWPLNLLLLSIHNYIFWCSRKGYKLNIYHLQKEIKRVYLEQETLSLMNSQNDTFKNDGQSANPFLFVSRLQYNKT